MFTLAFEMHVVEILTGFVSGHIRAFRFLDMFAAVVLEGIGM
jgi:hypothetical protein